MRKRVLAAVLIIMITLSLNACTSINGSTESGEVSRKDRSSVNDSINLEQSYEPMTTFEYTEDMLYEMNNNNDDFEIIKEIDGRIIISGQINRSPVKNDEYVLEQLCMIRSVLGLVNPKQQLVFSPESSSEDHYVFYQYHGGLRFYGSRVTVNIDSETKLINYVDAVITREDILKQIGKTPLLSESDVIAKVKADYSGSIDKMILWDMKEYKDSPTPAYIAKTDDMVLIINASDGNLIDSWSTIIT